jgi:serralysin
MHSGVVAAYDPTTNRVWLIDNWKPGGAGASIGYTSFVLDPNSTERHFEGQFAVYRLDSAQSNIHDIVYGRSSADFLGGGRGNDTLGGRGGDDTLWGGAGDDILLGGSQNDTMIGGDGIDAAAYDFADSAVTVALVTGAQNTGGWGIDTLIQIENLTGSKFNDTLVGNSGANVLDGGLGSDTLRGSNGSDTFAFTTALGTSNVDTVADFNVAADTFRLENAMFTGLAAGLLAASAFFKGNAAHDVDDRIIYNAANGALFFDKDGTGAAAAVHFATVSTGLAMTNNDFVVV